MEKNTNKPEGYFSFNTPTGHSVAKGGASVAPEQPAFNDFDCMPESEKAKKSNDDSSKRSDIGYF